MKKDKCEVNFPEYFILQRVSPLFSSGSSGFTNSNL